MDKREDKVQGSLIARDPLKQKRVDPLGIYRIGTSKNANSA
jgi:hypothetical protein